MRRYHTYTARRPGALCQTHQWGDP